MPGTPWPRRHNPLRKGREVLVAGMVESGHYTDRQGNIVDTLKLTGQVVKVLGSRRDDKAFGVEIPEIPF